MSVETVVTEGFGSFGDVAHVITNGFDIGAASLTPADATILTQAFGSLTAASAFLVTEGFQSGVAVTPPTGQVQQDSGLGGTKARKKVRGPYSDPRIYEAYIARCIAEREGPRVNVELAIVKEALVDEVAKRAQSVERDALLRENQILERLLALEKAKRDITAIKARQKQIDRQVADLEYDEARFLLAVFDEL